MGDLMWGDDADGSPHLRIALPAQLRWLSRRVCSIGGTGVIYAGTAHEAEVPLAYVFAVNASGNPDEPRIPEPHDAEAVAEGLKLRLAEQGGSRGSILEWIHESHEPRHGGLPCIELAWTSLENAAEWFNHAFRVEVSGVRMVYGIAYDMRRCVAVEPALLMCRKEFGLERDYIGTDGLGPGLRFDRNPSGQQYLHIPSL